MTKTKKTPAISCYIEKKLYDQYEKLDGDKPTLSSLLEYALAGYLGEVSGQEQMYQRVLSFNVKIRRGIADQKREQEEKKRALEEERKQKETVLRGYVEEAVRSTRGKLTYPEKTANDFENNQDYFCKIRGYIEVKYNIIKMIKDDMVISVYQELKGAA